ncbi:hypothetical protein Glove_428g31 [Diversispora epigaea]|uniref:C2 domain-containing protein n=1 Tax=Diversispora epigaea TaxID=1348612 RepID=A0A397GU22_9GLOM|nr:hypothetical protein Glove_428g31 [Diversispora epigaea]
MILGKLEVLVASAKNLKATDYVGKNDPYVALSVDGEHKQKTKVIDGGGANPTWDHSFIFNLNEGQNKLYVQVYDSDAGAASADDFIGGTTIPLEKLFKSGIVDEWYPLLGDNSNESGSINLKMKFTKGQGGPEFSNLGPEAGPIPTGYGLGAPPPMTGTHQQPPTHQHSGTTPFPSIHKEHESRDSKEHEKHEKHETDWVKNAAIAGAALASAGALAYAGKKLYDKHEEKKHEEDHEKREKVDKKDKDHKEKDKDHKDKDKKDKHDKEDKKDKDKKDKKDKDHKDKDHKDKDKKDKDKKDKDKKDKKDKHKYDD